MSLAERLKAQIAAGGPLNVAQYMTACLHDPQGGYYTTRPRLGETGDFITAPLVSQMFGELIGLWAVETWSRMGRPSRVLFVEVGPGDGTLMSDALRAARLAPAFLAAAQLHLIDASPTLIEAQRRRLGTDPLTPNWTDSLAALPSGAPVILIANELLDCLPARQFVRTDRGWAERMVGLDEAGELSFGLAARPLDRTLPPVEPGAVIEVSATQEAFGAAVGALIARQGGAALLIDYGRARFETGDTLQALKGHHKRSPLETPGEADLTVHADFPAVAAAARAAGASAAPILTQGEFLLRLGLAERAQALIHARPDRASLVEKQLARLIDADQMGTLFKALAVHAPPELIPPGFESAGVEEG
jgi:NADH dehydrogenase [ubiquinone] 1 alpha subcomplex assembly factor 7